MIIFKRISDLSSYLNTKRSNGQTVGFVPTMGALHEGHLTLLQTAKTASDVTVCSIFVNPTQFNDKNDFEKYPVTIEKDIELLIKNDCNILFLPSVKEMYPEGTSTDHKYELGALETTLEGFYRPGHFQGVCRIVDKLLTAVQPDLLFMGQKDFQQCMVINSLLKQKFEGIKLKIVPTVREIDGLAMSSRNVRLSPEARKKALVLSKVLQHIIASLSTTSFDDLIKEGKKEIVAAGFSSIDYLEICIPETLQKANFYTSDRKYVVLVAAFIDDVRLIDNMLS
jgi:pantoate--beta-alanine ligase